ncbi:response regulator transcription factor [Shimazuella kribbensis]|uniref:response regulator transcription factor n=1 Tax=Shimazuella kribbensis TaxID=139808 RepID=UPI00041E31F3|nr:response regulator transcription factor [Shimazuella kribbensis]
MKKHLLYIEDDLEIGNLVTEDLLKRNYDVKWLVTGVDAMEYIEQTDLVILDIMLPELDGFSLGQRIKRKYPKTPILLFSARTALEDKLQGLDFADDYVIKPCHPDELVARIEVLLRRFGEYVVPEIHLAHLQIDLEKRRIIHVQSNHEISLTAKQYHILAFFLRHLNQILTKEQIYEAVWAKPYMDDDTTVMVHIRHLREKIEVDPSQPQIIETIRGIGYRVRQ